MVRELEKLENKSQIFKIVFEKIIYYIYEIYDFGTIIRPFLIFTESHYIMDSYDF